MSITNKPKLLVAGSAVAISAMGLLTGPAIANAAPTCTFNGTFILNQSNGFRVEVPWNGRSPAGTALAFGNNQQVALSGPVTGGITSANNEIAFVVDWNGPSQGQYVGTFDAGGNVRGGFNQDLSSGSKASWDSVTPFTCVEPAAPKPQPVPEKKPDPKPETPPVVVEPTATVTDDVDVYDAPGGDGNVIGILRKGEVVKVVNPCPPADWCALKDGRFAWGEFFKNN